MKRILITGVNSYIGNAVERYLAEYNASVHNTDGEEVYRTEKISLRDGTWQSVDFGAYDSILHVAGIAHADINGVSEETKALYYRVNCDLAVEVAKKARTEGVRQFIYLSSVIVYGDSAGVGADKCITSKTRPAPTNFYGDSKWQAEQKLRAMETQTFKVAAVRSPMVYGKGSKGNFPMLIRLAEKLPVFPGITNRRSMIYVENLAEYLRLLVESGKGGLHLPQNAEYATTAQLIQMIGAAKGKKIKLWKVLNPLVKLASLMPGKIGGMTNKAFGTLIIDKSMSEQELQGYQIYSLEESIGRSV